MAAEEVERDRAWRIHGEGRADAGRPTATRLRVSGVADHAASRDAHRRVRRHRAPTAATRESRTGQSDVQSTPAWSPDGRTLAYTTLPQSHTRARRQHLRRADRQQSPHPATTSHRARPAKDVYDAKADVSAGTPQWTPDGKRILFSTGERAYTAVYAYDVAGGKLSKVADKTAAFADCRFSTDGSTVAFAVDSPDAPADVHVSDLTFATPTRSSRTSIRRFATCRSARPRVVTWKSSDGTPVEGVLIKPVGYQQGRRYPMLVEAHGGPTGATNASFKASWGSPGQVWAGQGWAVLYPNPRGSTGYGEKFTRANIMDWGGGDYRDIMSGVDDMVRRGLADSTKLGVRGLELRRLA